MKRVPALTGIRAVAAIMVFLYHNRKYWFASLPPAAVRMLNEFHTGVSLFFVLSGFLIGYTYRDAPLDRAADYRRYLFIRMARIYPVYLLLLAAKFIDTGFPSAKEAIYTFSLLHGFSDAYNLSGLPQAWSLTVEMSFYAVAPFLFFLLKRNVLRTVLTLALLAGLTVGIGYGWRWLNGNPDRFFYDWFFVFNGTFPGRFFEFVCGVLLAQMMLFSPQKIRWKRATPVGGCALLLCIYALGFFEADIYHHGTEKWGGLLLRNLLFPLCAAVFFYGLITEKTAVQKLLSARLLVLMGNASFIFYLVHINYVNNKLAGYVFLPDRNFTLLWVLSVALYWCVEKPVYNFLRRRAQRPFRLPAFAAFYARRFQ